MFEQAFVDIEPAPRGALALSSFVQVVLHRAGWTALWE
jgi:hypothetical protein